jgi:hypothetical protein
LIGLFFIVLVNYRYVLTRHTLLVKFALPTAVGFSTPFRRNPVPTVRNMTTKRCFAKTAAQLSIWLSLRKAFGNKVGVF